MIKIMNQEWYNSLDTTYGNTKAKDLPEPIKGVPMSAEEYDYKTYYVKRMNEEGVIGETK